VCVCVCVCVWEREREREREEEVMIQPTRAIVARYIAVVMFDKKTMA
jgi:hypothetical protein